MAYHFSWSHDEILGMPHWERHRWCEEISTINDKLNQDAGGSSTADSGGIELVNPEFEG